MVILSCHNIYCQPIDSASFKLYPRFSFYSYEKDGEFLLHVPENLKQSSLSVTITTGEKIFVSWNGKPGKSILRIPFAIELSPSVYRTTASISVPSGSKIIYLATTELIILSYKANEVKTDRLTGGLL